MTGSSLIAQDANILGGALTASTVDLTNASVQLSAPVNASSVAVHSGGTLVTAGEILDCAFHVYQGGVVVAHRIDDRCSNAVWTIDQGTVAGWSGLNILSGDWNITGPYTPPAGLHAAFGRMTSSVDAALRMHLASGAQVEMETLTAAGQSGFTDGQDNELLYGAPGELPSQPNRFAAGTDQAGRLLYFGDQTTIGLWGSPGGAQLMFDLSCCLVVGSDFAVPHVSEAWNTQNVDVTLEVTRSAFGEITQTFELISPLPAAGAPALVFLDVPSRGAFRDLTVAGCWETPAPEAADFVNAYHNCAVDDGPQQSWSSRQEPGPAECAYFQNITIGPNRRVDFHTDAADVICPIYYTCNFTHDATDTFYLDGVPCTAPDCMVTRDLIKLARCAYYGDWNGDGTITGRELLTLQSAINGGPSHYLALYDANGDGVLQAGNNSAELTLFANNYARQPGNSCQCSSSLASGMMLESASVGVEDDGLDDGLDEGLDDAEPVDVAALAAWLAEQLSPEDLAAFISQASDTAAAHADDAIGAEMRELLIYLQ